MKMEFAEDHVKSTHGISEQKSFAIRTNAHAFKLLSSGLYSDKITAVLREIGCNATDAHIEYGTPDVPIEVKLPNRIDPQFHIRDFGPGLAHEDVMELYTTYFASTKQSSNDFTGAFGLGSKSPFSYVDSFSIVSVHGGKMRTYSAHLDNDGSPTIALLATEDAPDDWQHGVSIKFPVKPGDYPYFTEKAQNVFRWFKVPPRILGAQPIAPITKIHDEPTFMLVKDDGLPWSHAVLMGNVLYPLSVTLLDGLSAKGHQIKNFQGVVLKMPIGSVQVAASREELQYDKAGIKALIKEVESVVEFVARDLANRLDQYEKASWEDKCKLQVNADQWGSNTRGYINWKDLLEAAGFKQEAAKAGYITRRHVPMPKYVGDKAYCRVMRPHIRSNAVEYTPTHKGMTTGPYPSQVNLDITPNTKIFYGRAKHGIARARAVLLDGTLSQVVFFTPPPGETDEKHAKEEAERLAKDMSGVPLAHIDVLPIPASALSTKAGGVKVKKPKNAHQKPMPSRMVALIAADNTQTSVDIATVTGADQHYMVRAPRSGADAFRSLDTTADKDASYERWPWSSMWTSFVSLQDLIGIKHTTNMVYVTAAEAKALDLQKRKWTPTDVMIRGWLASKPVQDKLIQVVSAWRPTVDLRNHHPGWAGALLSMLKEGDPQYAAMAPHLGKFDADLRQILDLSRKAGKHAGLNEPPALTRYNQVASLIRGVPSLVPSTRSFLNLGELSEQLQKHFPMLAIYDHMFVYRVKNHPAKLAEIAKFLLT